MSDHVDVTQMPADWRGMKHRSAKVERCLVGYLVTFSIVTDAEDYQGQRRKSVMDERVAFATLQEVHDFLDQYFGDGQ